MDAYARFGSQPKLWYKRAMSFVDNPFSRSYHKGYIAVLIFLFSSVMVLGVLSGTGMSDKGDIMGCPMMGGTMVVCDMDLVSHLQTWEHMTVSVIPGLALLFLVIVGALYFITRKILLEDRCSRISVEIRRRAIPVWLLFDALKQALAAGILHPKIFTLSA